MYDQYTDTYVYNTYIHVTHLSYHSIYTQYICIITCSHDKQLLAYLVVSAWDGKNITITRGGATVVPRLGAGKKQKVGALSAWRTKSVDHNQSLVWFCYLQTLGLPRAQGTFNFYAEVPLFGLGNMGRLTVDCSTPMAITKTARVYILYMYVNEA